MTRFTTTPSAAALALSALIGLAAPPAWAVDNCYEAGNGAMDAGRFGDAVRAFEVAAALPECARSRAGLLHGKGFALEKQLDAGGAATLACDAAATYREVIGLEPTSRVGQAAQAALPGLEARCAATQVTEPDPSPPPTPPPAPAAIDHTTEWALTGGALGALSAGGVLLILAADAADTRDTADARALAAPAGSDDEAAALADFETASDRANLLGVTGYALAGVGGALAIGAVVAWLMPDDGSPTAWQVSPTPGGIVVGGAF